MKRYTLALLTVCTLWCVMPSLFAGPWLMPGNPAIKSDIDLLSDYGFIQAPTLTWPIAWKNIGPALTSPNSQKLLKTVPAYVKSAYGHILKLYKENTKLNTLHTSASMSGGSHINPFPMFATRARADFTAGAAAEYTTQQFAGNLSLQYGKYQDINKRLHFNGSYADWLLGNWSIGFDKISRWWGPAYSGSMILSENAVPMPAFTVQRMQAYPAKGRWFGWMGPWTLTSSLSVLDAGRPHPNTLTWFTNISFKPSNSVDISLSRVSMFSGKGRPFNWLMFRNLITFQTQCEHYNSSYYCKHFIPGKDKADISVKWSLMKQWKIPVDLYLDTGFNDENRILIIPIPARTAYILGASTWKNTGLGLLRLYGEFENNLQYRYYIFGNQQHHNYGGNGAYPYTYYGNILASPLGSDGIGYTIGGILNENNNMNYDDFSIRYFRINPYNLSGRDQPYAKQNILWASVGRSFALPKSLGDLSVDLGYLYAMQTGPNRLRSSASIGVTWGTDLLTQ